MKTNYLKTIIAVLIFMILGENVFTQYFFKSYDFPPYGSRTDIGRSVKRAAGTLASGWSIAGFSNSMPNAGCYDWMLLRLNSAGLVNCAALLGFPLDDSCFSHVQLNETTKRFVLAGFYRAANTKEKASWSMVDTLCAHIMTKMINDTSRHQYRQVVTEP